jgi:hypothetical protein
LRTPGGFPFIQCLERPDARQEASTRLRTRHLKDDTFCQRVIVVDLGNPDKIHTIPKRSTGGHCKSRPCDLDDVVKRPRRLDFGVQDL